MFRQLMAFQTGSRHEAEAAPMRFVAARLNQSQMIALAAYGASLTP
jgi:cytochrome c553